MSSVGNAGFIYLLTGPSHGARLVVSLRSLRQHYDGPITVYTTQSASHEIGTLCANDARLRIDHRRCTQIAVKKNSSFITKIALLPEAPYVVGAYLDCDTLVVGDPTQLHELALKKSFCATRFATWSSNGRILRRRIERWRHLRQNAMDPQLLGAMVDRALESWPAVNGGVFGFRRDASILKPWLDLSMVGKRTFICDEIALQLLLPEFDHEMLDCRFNCSPLHAGKTIDVRIWHFHGEKHLRRDQGRAIWLPEFQACFAENVAGIRDWAITADPDLADYVGSSPKV